MDLKNYKNYDLSSYSFFVATNVEKIEVLTTFVEYKIKDACLLIVLIALLFDLASSPKN